MSRPSFEVGMRYQLKGTTYIIRQREMNGTFQVEDMHVGEHWTVTEETLLAAYRRDELHFERSSLPSKEQSKDTPRSEEV